MKQALAVERSVLGLILLLPFTLAGSGQAVAQTCAAPPSGLVGWWPGDGNATDVIGANHGSLENGATLAPGFLTSGSGQTFSFDGVDDEVLVPEGALGLVDQSSAPHRSPQKSLLQAKS